MKNNNKHICIISSGYPTPSNPKNTFIDQLVCAFADLGFKCSVISPIRIKSPFKKEEELLRSWIKYTKKGNKIDIYNPPLISFSNKKIIGFNTSILSLHSFKNTVWHEFKRLQLKPDILYGHFINPSGLTAAYIGKKLNIPAFIANGESSPTLYEILGKRKVARELESIAGIVSVSSENKNLLIESEIIETEKIEVFPNAIDNEIFYEKDRDEIREKLGYKHNDFIVIYVGHFNHRKGSLRLSESLDKLDGVKSIFIGSGPDVPDCNDILHCGKVPHSEMVNLLNVADVFVLPTLNEGCCNAIIEAMACGLPIISSDLPFNDDILDDKNSIRINSKNTDDISNAIKFLRENPLKRKKMANASLIKAKNLNIESRAQNIASFFRKQSGGN